MRREFEAARPVILGALLDAMACGLRRLPGLRLGRLPRLADFATWATACEAACFHDGAFMGAFNRNREESIRTVLEADVVATAVLQFMDIRDEWEGTATELLGHLTAIVGEAATKRKTWPPAANALSGRLRRAAPFLRKRGIGIEWTTSKDHAKDRRISLSWTKIEMPEDRPHRPQRPQANENNCLAEKADVSDRPQDRPHRPQDRPHNSGEQPFEIKGNNGARGGADDADDVSASSSTPPRKETVAGNGGELPTCAQCQMADGRAALFEVEDGEPVWLHMECRPFWVKAQRSPWR